MSEIKSLSKAIDILDLLSFHHNGISLQEISDHLGYPKSTIHSLLSTMRDRGLVKQLPNGHYSLGIKLFEYGCAVSRGMDINRVVKPYLERLATTTGFGAVISVLDAAGVVSFDYATAPQGVQIVPELGSRLPYHCTSQGKLLLSQMTDSAALNILNKLRLTAFTPHSITNPDDLKSVIADIREKGYAIEDGEYKIGLRSVSAPVYDDSCVAKYALTTIGFFRRRDSEDFVQAIDATLKEAAELSVALGYHASL